MSNPERTPRENQEKPALRLVASQIRPLPEEVSPSDRFRRRMRRRLLALKSWNAGKAA